MAEALLNRRGGGAKINGIVTKCRTAPGASISKGDFVSLDMEKVTSAYKVLPLRCAGDSGGSNGKDAPQAVSLFGGTVIALACMASPSYVLTLQVYRVGAEENGIGTVVRTNSSAEFALGKLSESTIVFLYIDSGTIVGIRFSISEDDLSATAIDNNWATVYTNWTNVSPSYSPLQISDAFDDRICVMGSASGKTHIGITGFNEAGWLSDAEGVLPHATDYSGMKRAVVMISKTKGVILGDIYGGQYLAAAAFSITNNMITFGVTTLLSENGANSFDAERIGNVIRVSSKYDNAALTLCELTVNPDLSITSSGNFNVSVVGSPSFRYVRYLNAGNGRFLLIVGMDSSGRFCMMVYDVDSSSKTGLQLQYNYLNNPNMYVCPAAVRVNQQEIHFIAPFASGYGGATTTGQLVVWRFRQFASAAGSGKNIVGVAKTSAEGDRPFDVIMPN